jgi:hypothetical protein
MAKAPRGVRGQSVAWARRSVGAQDPLRALEKPHLLRPLEEEEEEEGVEPLA